MTAQPNAHMRFRRAIERRALWLAEDAARELPNLPLEDALQLVLGGSKRPQTHENPVPAGFSLKRMNGLEPSTFCMASRRSTN